jgi:hypothetical protein
MARKTAVPASIHPVMRKELFSPPWFRFFTDMAAKLDVPAPSPATAFDNTINTDDLPPASIYCFTSNLGGTLYLGGNVLNLGTASSLYTFTIKDEGGNASINPLVIDGNGATIDGQATYTVPTDYGAVSLYTNGTSYFTV